MIPFELLHIDLMQIELFLRCAESQNFTRAATSMHVTPGMVSKRIGALESALGVVLAFCAAERPPVRLPAATQRCQRPGVNQPLSAQS